MCEIAIDKVDDSTDIDRIVSNAALLYQQNSDGLGVVAVHRIADDQFLFNRYKRLEPEFEADGDLYSFLEANDSAWRFVIHARLATHGGTGFAETHPIQTGGCPVCDVDFVVHNGVVRDSESTRTSDERDGHLYTTDVDSEVISHQYGELPETLDEDFEEPDIRGSLNYILFAEDKILIRHTRKYNVSSEMRMSAKSRRWVQDSVETTGFLLFKPDGSVESKSRSYTSKRSTKRSRTRTTTGVSAAANWGWVNNSGSEQDATVSDDGDSCTTCTTEGTSSIEDYEDAVMGEMTLRHPRQREWVSREREGNILKFHCDIHDETFVNDCSGCWELDANAWDLAGYNGNSFQKAGEDADDDEQEQEVVTWNPGD